VTFNPRALHDPIATDPLVYDQEYPPEHFVTSFRSGGAAVQASVWTAQGKELKASVVLGCTSFGGDRLESLIIPLLHAGLNVLTFHPRGMWDANSVYSMIGALEDVHSAVEFLRSSDMMGKRTPRGNGYRVDTAKIGGLGLSGGGGTLGVVAAAEDEAIDFAIAVAVCSFPPYRGLPMDEFIEQRRKSFDFVMAETAGRIDGERRLRSMTPDEMDRLSIITQAPKLVNKKLLLVGGARDTGFPLEHHHFPIVNALRDAGATRLKDVTLDADHLFLQARIALARVVIAWLRSEQII